MKTRDIVITLMAALTFAVVGCANNRYNTQRGAMIGAALGAGYGAAIGGNAESTLIGVTLGGLTGAMIGNYHDQRYQYENSYRKPVYHQQSSYSYSVPTKPVRISYYEGRWVTVPGQYVGYQYVPRHTVWLPEQRTGIIVERP